MIARRTKTHLTVFVWLAALDQPTQDFPIPHPVTWPPTRTVRPPVQSRTFRPTSRLTRDCCAHPYPYRLIARTQCLMCINDAPLPSVFPVVVIREIVGWRSVVVESGTDRPGKGHLVILVAVWLVGWRSI